MVPFGRICTANQQTAIAIYAYSQFLRVRPICTHDADFDRHGSNLITYFRERGYPSQLLMDTYNQVKSFSRESLLEIKHAGIQGTIEKPDNQIFAI